MIIKKTTTQKKTNHKTKQKNTKKTKQKHKHNNNNDKSTKQAATESEGCKQTKNKQ